MTGPIAFFFLGETLAPLQAFGVSLVLVGLVVNVYGGHAWARFAASTK